MDTPDTIEARIAVANLKAIAKAADRARIAVEKLNKAMMENKKLKEEK